VAFNNPEAVCTCGHTDEIKPTDKDDKIFPKETLHDVNVIIVAAVNLADPVVRRLEKLLALDIKIATKIIPKEVPDNQKRLENASDDEDEVELDLNRGVGIGLFEREVDADGIAEWIGLDED
jgi:hypothetical protein